MSKNQKLNRKKKLLQQQNGCCAYCGKELTLDNATIDHVIPKAIMPWNSVDNLVISCQPCNSGYGSSAPKEKIMSLYKLAFQ